MTDHSAYDGMVDQVLDAAKEAHEIVRDLAYPFKYEKCSKCCNSIRARRLSRLESRMEQCREAIEHNVLMMLEEHIIVCGDEKPWIHEEGRNAKSSGEWVKHRFGAPFDSLDTQLMKSKQKDLDDAVRSRIELEQKLKDANAEIERLKAAYDKERKEHLKDLADPDIH